MTGATIIIKSLKIPFYLRGIPWKILAHPKHIFFADRTPLVTGQKWTDEYRPLRSVNVILLAVGRSQSISSISADTYLPPTNWWIPNYHGNFGCTHKLLWSGFCSGCLLQTCKKTTFHWSYPWEMTSPLLGHPTERVQRSKQGLFIGMLLAFPDYLCGAQLEHL